MRYQLWTALPRGFFKKTVASADKLSDLTSEIVACIACKDNVRVSDTLRERHIDQSEIMRILNID